MRLTNRGSPSDHYFNCRFAKPYAKHTSDLEAFKGSHVVQFVLLFKRKEAKSLNDRKLWWCDPRRLFPTSHKSLVFNFWQFFSAEEKQKSWKECEEMQQKSKKAKSCAFVRAAEFSSFIIHSDLGKKGLLLKNDENGFYFEAGNGRLLDELPIAQSS